MSPVELTRQKLQSLDVPRLRLFSKTRGVESKGAKAELILRLLGVPGIVGSTVLDSFIQQEYVLSLGGRYGGLTADELLVELHSLPYLTWGAIQGQLDSVIQTKYVRVIPRLSDLDVKVKAAFLPLVADHVRAIWYNHWSTLLIEDYFAQHPKIVPTLANLKGTDFFFGGEPFDLKVTYVPTAMRNPAQIGHFQQNPLDLAKWFYENQSALRFGSDNRLFLVLSDVQQPDESWQLKRDAALWQPAIEHYLNTETVSEADRIAFTFNKQTYTALTKILFVTI